MPSFNYIAYTKTNEKRTGALEAVDRSTAIGKLQDLDLRPISIREISKNSKRAGNGLSFLSSKKVKSDELVIFTRELSAMVGAGVPLLRALNSLESHSDSKALTEMLKGVIKDVESGAPLADSLEKFPKTFSPVYINMVRAGETAGILDEILKRLAYQQEKNATIRKKIKSAMTYPMVLVSITILAFFGLMLFVIPQIGKILTDLGGEDAKLPALTQAMLAISSFMISYWFIVFPVFIGSIVLLIRFIHTPKGKNLFHHFVLGLPGVKTIIMKIAVARFSRTFSALIGAGVPVLESLHVTAHALGNVVYEQALIDAAEEVKNGSTLSSIIERSPLFPAIVPQMLSVGEETGQTDSVLVKVADFYEEEVDVAIEGLSSIIEPVMIVFMGAMVGVIAASVMMPIASLSQNIKG